MDQMLCKEFYLSFGDYFVQQSKTGWVVGVEGLTRNFITNMKLFNIFLI